MVVRAEFVNSHTHPEGSVTPSKHWLLGWLNELLFWYGAERVTTVVDVEPIEQAPLTTENPALSQLALYNQLPAPWMPPATAQ
jgi:hypothetical protein